MTTGSSTVVYPVRDLEARRRRCTPRCWVSHPCATALLRRLQGRRPGDRPQPPRPPPGHVPTGRLRQVDDVTRRVDQLVADGAEAQQPITDVGGGTLIATVTDADGNVTGLAQTP